MERANNSFFLDIQYKIHREKRKCCLCHTALLSGYTHFPALIIANTNRSIRSSVIAPIAFTIVLDLVSNIGLNTG